MPRVKPHAKIHTSIGSHRKTAEVYADNDLLAMYVRLLLLATERYADRTGDSFNVHDSELTRLAGRGWSRPDLARTSLQRLADLSPISVEPIGNLWRISIPNFAKKQGFGLRNGVETENPSTTTSTTTSIDKGKGVQPPPKGKKEPPPAWSLNAAALLAGLLVKRRPGAMIPSKLTGWATEIAKIPAPPETIEGAIRWLYSEANEPPYRIEVQSGRALREKFAKAHAAAERARVGVDAPKPSTVGALPDWRPAAPQGDGPLLCEMSDEEREEAVRRAREDSAGLREKLQRTATTGRAISVRPSGGDAA